MIVRTTHLNADGSYTLSEYDYDTDLTSEGVTFSRDEGMSDEDWQARIAEAMADYFTPVDANNEPLTGLALTWHRTAPSWLKAVVNAIK